MSSKSPLRTDRLKQCREARGLSQREFARLTGLGESQVRKYEAGQNDPSGRNLKLIAEQLRVSIDYLLGVTDDPHVQIDSGNLSEDERAMLETFRRDGWLGVVRLGVEHLGK